MANVKSINGNPIVVDASGIENGAITGKKINDAIVKENRYGFDIDSIGLTRGHYLATSTGKPVAENDHWVSDFISVSEGMKFGYALAGGTVVSLLCEYSSDETFVRSVLTGAGYRTPVTGTYTVPSGVGYIRVCTLNWEADENCANYRWYGIAFVLIGSQKALVESLSSQTDMFTDEEYLQHLEYKHKALIDSSGQIYSGQSHHHITGFIPVPTGTVLQYSMVQTAGFNLISAYDDGFTFVEAVAVGQGGTVEKAVTGTYVVPDGVSYIRVGICYKDDVPLSGQYLRSVNYREKWGINERNDDAIQAIQHSRRYRFSNADSADAPLTLLHFTDIHGTQDALERIVEFRDKNSYYIDDAICTGDMVAASIAYQGMGFWDAVDGAESILMTVGNHDFVTQATGGTVVSVAEQYGMYIKPYMESWGNVVIVADKTWWYKDYPSNKVRLIGLGSSYMMPENDMTEQVSWLRSVLSGAAEADYSVIVAQHYMPSDPVYIDCNFTQVDGRSDGSLYISTLILGAIQDFIDGGGKFVCHLCGHTHKDQVLYSNAYPHQLFINATTASSYFLQQQFGDQARVKDTKSIDAFNVITFDTNRSQLKIIRVGADRDMIMRSRKVLCMNYDTKTIVYQG